MPASSLTLRVPGKLMIAGEYAVLEPHAPAVVVAVDRYLTATVALAPDYRLSVPALGLLDTPFVLGATEVAFAHPHQRLSFVAEALTVALTYVREQFLLPLPFHLTLESELDDATGRKLGLGSSAAATVATIAAVTMLLHDDDAPPPSAEVIFKLAAIAHFRAQGSGSGADVAASTFGGWLRYSSFHPEWLRERLARGGRLDALVDGPWPFFSVERLSTLPKDLRLCVGWTGAPAATSGLIARVQRLREVEPTAYGAFLDESRQAVEQLVDGLASHNRARALAAIERNRTALVALGERADVVIETPALAELHRCAILAGGSAKPSGAGGGDCGIALVFGEAHAETLEAAWRQADLTPLRLGVSDAGVTVTHLAT